MEFQINGVGFEIVHSDFKIAGISTSTDLMDFQDTSEFSNALVIHQVQTKEIMTVTVFGYPILISMDFYDFSSPSTPQF